MANALMTITNNFTDGKAMLDGIEADELVSDWRVNIPYAAFLG